MITEIVASGHPAHAAIAAPGLRAHTYEQLAGTVADVGRSLRGAGIGREAVVALLAPGGPPAAVGFLAIAAASIVAPLDPSMPPAALLAWVQDVRPDLLVVADDLAASVDLGGAGVRTATLHQRDDCAGLVSLDLVGAGPSPDGLEPHPDDVALILHTSGTTARPKRVPITHRNLAASAANIGRTLGLTDDDRCLDVMPLFHIHGLVAGVLATLRAGGTVICPPPFNAIDVFGWIAEQDPTWMTAVPTMYQGMLDRAAEHADVIGASRLRLLRSSSSALPGPVHGRLEEVFGVPVVEAYGMTEAAHQMASNTPADRLPGSVGRAAGPEITILGDDDRPVDAGTRGRVAIRGENVISGYSDPDANVRSFVDGWFLTGDLGRLDDEGRLILTGRSKEMINRGGESIAPAEIDAVLLAHPDVARAMAFAVPDHRLGEQVAALVVPVEGSAPDETALRRHVADQMAPSRIPRRIVFSADLPRGPTGKPRRLGIAEELGLEDLDGPPQPVHDYVAPTGAVEVLLADLWSDVIGRDHIGVHDRFFDAGGDSLLAMRLLARVADEVNEEISMLDFFDRPTISEQARLLETQLLS